jgi:SAM-dependent methyltransferase
VIVVVDRMNWDETGLTIDGTRFRVGFGADVTAGPNELLLMKPRWMVERYVELVNALKPRRVVELGIFLGGSVALLTLLAKPERYVATDLRTEASTQFDAWLEAHDDVVRPYYGLDQSDSATLRTILADEFADADLDLVIDDASHLLGPSRSSFNVLFPVLRPGGIYVIEDWERDHYFERQMTKDPSVAERVQDEIAKRPELVDRVPLTRLVFEIVLASAYTDFIDGIEIRRNWFSVTRGSEQPKNDEFDVARCHSGLGRRVLGDELSPGP